MIPVALNLQNKNVLIVGGGKVALRQAQKFLQQQACVTVVSPDFLDDFKALDLSLKKDFYQQSYLENMFLVYSATSSPQVNHQVVIDCNLRNILCGSATKDENASFYGMSYQQNDVGMVAYSSHQQFPYVKPLLNELMTVVEKNRSRLQLLAWLRPYVLQLENDHKDIFGALFAAPLELLQFLADSLTCGHGVVIVYHHNKFDNSYHFEIEPVIYLSIEEFHQYQHLLMFDVTYICFPLALADGIIYRRMISQLSSKIINAGAVIQSECDIAELSQLLKSERQPVWILHDRRDSWLKDMLRRYCPQALIYDFNDKISLEMDQGYELRVLILGHGKHYRDYQLLVKQYYQAGYDIVFAGNLLDCPAVKTYLTMRIKALIDQKA